MVLEDEVTGGVVFEDEAPGGLVSGDEVSGDEVSGDVVPVGVPLVGAGGTGAAAAGELTGIPLFWVVPPDHGPDAARPGAVSAGLCRPKPCWPSILLTDPG
ncbi:hypothetical protein GCM10022223_00210 [Kineosporia mesophila]|uniref:Uncharacterized protein n=1 Tax=Kineosporia mesophila TaxID=566012 RepID=A0ABP6YSL5_9ACTN